MRHNFSSIREMGRDIESKVTQQDPNAIKQHKHSIIKPILSAKARLISRAHTLTSNTLPGASKYQNPAMEIAFNFALKVGDRKFAKFIGRYTKYEKESYEHAYEAARIAFTERKNKNSRKQLVEKKTEEIKEIEADIKLPKLKRKKKIIALEKEIKEIIVQGEKYEKINNQRYSRHYAKARRFEPYRWHEQSNKLDDIIRYINASGIIRKMTEEEIKEQRKNRTYEPGQNFYKIDSTKLDKLYAELEEKFYPKQEKRSR